MCLSGARKPWTSYTHRRVLASSSTTSISNNRSSRCHSTACVCTHTHTHKLATPRRTHPATPAPGHLVSLRWRSRPASSVATTPTPCTDHWPAKFCATLVKLAFAAHTSCCVAPSTSTGIRSASAGATAGTVMIATATSDTKAIAFAEDAIAVARWFRSLGMVIVAPWQQRPQLLAAVGSRSVNVECSGTPSLPRAAGGIGVVGGARQSTCFCIPCGMRCVDSVRLRSWVALAVYTNSTTNHHTLTLVAVRT